MTEFLTEPQYKKLADTGMLFEIHPQFSGVFADDSAAFALQESLDSRKYQGLEDDWEFLLFAVKCNRIADESFEGIAFDVKDSQGLIDAYRGSAANASPVAFMRSSFPDLIIADPDADDRSSELSGKKATFDDLDGEGLTAEWEQEELPPQKDRMLKWFEWSRLPPHLQAVSRPFFELANRLDQELQSGPERTVAFRKLLEAKDAAVRAAVNPGA